MHMCRRNEIELCARLLGVSAHALEANPGLIALVVVTKIALTLAILPIFAFQFLAYTNGHIVRNGTHCCFTQHMMHDGILPGQVLERSHCSALIPILLISIPIITPGLL